MRDSADLRPILKCNDVVRSLKTGRYRGAYECARTLKGEVAQAFNALIQERFMDRAHLKKRVQQYAETVLKDAAEDYHTHNYQLKLAAT